MPTYRTARRPQGGPGRAQEAGLQGGRPCTSLLTLIAKGEAIAWHLKEALGLKEANTRRVTFNEITKRAVQKAFTQPGTIDMDRVAAQEARRFLDRVVGYKLSPLLSRKLARHLSAGRVQSVAVRLIVDREREIQSSSRKSTGRSRPCWLRKAPYHTIIG